MSDPFSVASGAVGVISLGLVVCGEIVDYGRAYRGYDEDIRNITAKAESLSETLEDLDDAIKFAQTTQPIAATRLSNKVIGIKQHITRLESVLQRYGPGNSTDGFARRARNQVKKTVYAFRKEALQDMAADLDSLQNTLQTALAVYSWKQNSQVLQEMKQMATLLTRENGKIPPSLLKDCCDRHENRQTELMSRSDVLSDTYSIRQGQRYVARYRSYNWWLGRAIEVSLNMTTGAGGFSIFPSLKVHHILPYGEPRQQYAKQLLDSLKVGGNFDDNFQTLKDSLSERRLDISCAMEYQYEVGSIFEILSRKLMQYALHGSSDLQRCKILELLRALKTESSNLDNPTTFNIWCLPSALDITDVSFIAHLAEIGFGFDVSINGQSMSTKDNLLLLLPKIGSVIQVSEVVKLICRENATELRLALQEQRISPNERTHGILIIDWAIGWPEGVQILLEFGADPRQYFRYFVYPGKGRQLSAEILLRAGCDIYPTYLQYIFKFNDDEAIMMLLVNELAERRKKLRCFAEESLPLDLIPGSGGKKLLDGSDCRKVLELLSDHKVPLPDPFASGAEYFLGIGDDETVYHFQANQRCVEALYQVGFLDTDRIDWEGKSPLVSLVRPWPWEFLEKLTETIHWHISKGANLHRSMGWTNESVSHALIWVIIEQSFNFYQGDHSLHSPKFESCLKQLVAMGDAFFAPTRVSDGCSCPCSPSGCTAVSTILRELTSDEQTPCMCSDCRRRVFDFVQEWDQSYWQEPHAFIRSLTFNALDLNHSCFSKTKKGCIIERNTCFDPDIYNNEETDDEQLLDEFEELLKDLEQKFAERRQPLKEFLPGYWYRRVKNYLLTRQPDDERHLKDAKSVGVELEFRGLSVPKWMGDCIARKVEELTGEEAVNEKCD